MIDNKDGNFLPLVEQFYSIQGEGFHTGKAACFIRVGGCDIGCRWCDSKASWNPNIHSFVSVNQILEKVLQTPAKSVVVTGGEPTLYNLSPLTDALKQHNIETFIEMAGIKPLTGTWDWVCLSPKKNVCPDEYNYKLANELKVIIYDDDDFCWAEDCAKFVQPECLTFLQPEWSRYSKIIDKIVDYAKNNPKWMVSLQSHKFMKIP